MKCKFIGIKHVSGISKKDGKPFDFSTAMLTSEMSDRDKDNGSHGLDVHVVSIPDKFRDVLNEANLGADCDVDFYFTRTANGTSREILGYVQIM